MKLEGKYYKAPFGAGTIVATIIVLILIIPFTAYQFFFVNPVIAVIISLGLVFSSLSVPLGYRVGLTKIVIRRLIWNFHIPISTITEIALADEENIQITPLSAIGNRGVFGWRCIVHLKKRGWTSIHSKRTSDMVIIATYNKSYLIAPKSPENFIEDVKITMKAFGRENWNGVPYQDGPTEIGSPGEDSDFAEVIED